MRLRVNHIVTRHNLCKERANAESLAKLLRRFVSAAGGYGEDGALAVERFEPLFHSVVEHNAFHADFFEQAVIGLHRLFQSFPLQVAQFRDAFRQR